MLNPADLIIHHLIRMSLGINLAIVSAIDGVAGYCLLYGVKAGIGRF